MTLKQQDPPSFDRDGYPTDETLERIEKWDAWDSGGLIEFIEQAWHSFGDVRRNGTIVELVTGGWSGNESLISAFRTNSVAWAVCWEMSQRGGLHRFEIPEKYISTAISKSHLFVWQGHLCEPCREAFWKAWVRFNDQQQEKP